MEPEARYTLVGAVLLSLLVAIALALVWLARSGGQSSFRYYTVHFEHQSLAGVQVGGDVDMRGVKVGRVESVAISRDDINRVNVLLRVDRDSPVSDNTVAVVDRSLLTGLGRIELVTPGAPGPKLTAIAPGEPYPVIPEGPNAGDLRGAIENLALSGTKALDSLNQVLDAKNREALAATLANLRQLSGALAQRLGKLDAVADALMRNSNDLGRSSLAIAAAVDRFTASAKPVASDAQIALQNFSAAVLALQREAAALSAKLEGAADSSTREIQATAQDLRATADILARAADELRNPRALILGPSPGELGPGEKLP